jgi:hypothetical protein
MYVPTEKRNEKWNFTILKKYIKKLQYNITIIAGDFNAQIGADSHKTDPI